MAATEVDSHHVHFAFLKPIGQRKGGKEAVKRISNVNETLFTGPNCPVLWNLNLNQWPGLMDGTVETHATFQFLSHFSAQGIRGVGWAQKQNRPLLEGAGSFVLMVVTSI
jgi:hypothetical protein